MDPSRKRLALRYERGLLGWEGPALPHPVTHTARIWAPSNEQSVVNPSPPSIALPVHGDGGMEKACSLSLSHMYMCVCVDRPSYYPLCALCTIFIPRQQKLWLEEV